MTGDIFEKCLDVLDLSFDRLHIIVLCNILFSDLIIAKIDSMRATEQLIVKCASVLGETFTRDMIESILPRVNRIKARKSFRVLRKTGIFECANLYNPHYSKFSKDTTEEDSALACYCPVFDEDVDRNLCNLMKFTNKTMMDTCYQLLMESQRKALHASSADYLEREADKMRHGIPYYSLERPPPNSDDNIGIGLFLILLCIWVTNCGWYIVHLDRICICPLVPCKYNS